MLSLVLSSRFNHLVYTRLMHSTGKYVGSKLQSYSQTLDKLSSSSSSDQNRLAPKIDCEVSQWKRTVCNASCGEGFRWKSRAIIVSVSFALT
jgi:hypothetical protein